MLQYYFSLRQFRLIKWSFFIHSTTPFIHRRLDSRIEPMFSDCRIIFKLVLFKIGVVSTSLVFTAFCLLTFAGIYLYNKFVLNKVCSNAYSEE